MRHNREAIEQAIFRPKKSTAVSETKIPLQEINYTFSGMEDEINDEGLPILLTSTSDKIMARFVSNKRGVKRLIRVATDGFFFNPLGIHDRSLFRKKSTAPPPQFVEVNQKCFELYLHFLKTKSERFLKEAQRQI